MVCLTDSQANNV